MKIFFFINIIILINACSLNSESKYWSKDNIKRINYEKKIDNIVKKSKDIMSMSYDEYKIFINNYTKNNKYPKIID